MKTFQKGGFALGVAAFVLLLQGCGKEQLEQVRQQNDALQAKVTQLEARLNTSENQLGQVNAEITRLRGSVDQLTAKQAAAAVAKPAGKPAAAPQKAVAKKPAGKPAVKKAAAKKRH